MQINEKLKFSENLSSRLCHDLITPMGAINTGLELLEEQEDYTTQEAQEILALIQQSAKTSSSRLGFYRVAFGTSGRNISLGDAQNLIERYYEKGKLSIHWPNEMDPHLTLPYWGRIVINAALWVGECAPRGGELKILPPSIDLEVLEVRLISPQVNFHEGVLEALKGELGEGEVTPRTIQSSLLRLLIQDMGYDITLEQPQPQELILKIS